MPRPLPALAAVLAFLLLMSATELKQGDNGHFAAEATINGTDIRVLVDTGATDVALSYEDATEVGLHPANLDYDVPVATANGMTKAAQVVLDKVDIDGVRVENVNGLVLPEGALHGTLLGMSFLGRLSSFKIEDGVLYLKE
jgi:aspartyl protease family protein